MSSKIFDPKSLLQPKYPFKNLVFQGGGVKACVYHGVLPVLEEYGILPQIERVAGASAGALQSTLLAFRLGAEETIQLYRTIDYSKIEAPAISLDEKTDQKRTSLIDVPLEKMRGNLDSANRFVRKYGLHSNEYLQSWLHTVIASQCGDNHRATFADFRKRRFRDLYITAVNITHHRVEIFSAETTPDVAVADAVVMSSTIPFFFEAVQFDGQSMGQGDFYIDGGALSNYPLTIFDDPKFKKGNRNFTYGVNWETLGCQLFTPEDCSNKNEQINNILSYAENVFETLVNVQTVAVDMRTVDRWRSIRISDCCVSALDFDIQHDESDPKYAEMVETGAQTARQYLENYHLPTDRFADVKEKLSDILDLWR